MKRLTTIALVCGLSLASLRGAEPVREFLQKRYKHSVPYAEGAAYTEADVAAVKEILADPAQKPYWANAVMVLGFIGGDEAVEALTAFPGGLQGEMDIYTLEALLSVPNALGFAANKGSAAALTYLGDTSTVAGWRAKGLTCQFQKYQGDELCLLMSKMSIRGLGISCKDSSRTILDQLLGRPTPPESESFAVLENVRESIQLYDQIEQKGLEQTFIYQVPQ